MRKTEELQFRPIRFHSMSINGSPGSKSIDEFFRSSLSQNVCYCVRSEAKTVNEIAADLGVSPVYVESEVDFLEEYGFLTAHKDKYLVNFLLSEPTEALLVRQDAMYKRAAALLADELFEELTDSGLMDDPRILCEQTDGPLDGAPRRDHNFLMWSLIPYIASRSGGRALDKRISFDEVATIRPDGAHNIFSATVMPDHLQLPEDYVHMERWSGPMCCINDGRAIWRVDSQWSERGEKWGIFDSEDVRLLCQYEKEKEHRLSRDEYARLTERGFVKTNGERGERFRAAWQFVVLNGGEIRKELLDIGDRVREKHRAEFDALRAAYITEVLETVPAHVRKMKEYELQFIFQSDGWFLLHCLTHLVNGGKLRLPTPDQRKALGMLMIFE